MTDTEKLNQQVSEADGNSGQQRLREVRSAAGLSTYVRALYYDKVTFVAVGVLVILAFSGLFAPIIAPYSPTEQNLALRNQPPMTSSESGSIPHLLGTDTLGRDVLSRIMYGARVSLAVGVSAVFLSGVVGVALGLLAGYLRGRVDDIVMRAVDIQLSFSNLLFALILLFVFGPSIVNVIIVLAVARWPVYARVARGMTLSLRENMYVESARAVGATDWRIMLRHILPNMLAPLVVLATLETASVILVEASLSFLGLGIQPPDSSWGLMLSAGRDYVYSAWWLIMFPGIASFLTALSLNLFASWFRGVTDPVQRWRYLRPRKSSNE
jgi:peptide/nickel transport system permease protein